MAKIKGNLLVLKDEWIPFWDDIGLDVIPLALVNDLDLTDAHNSAGPMFFRREHCAPAIFSRCSLSAMLTR